MPLWSCSRPGWTRGPTRSWPRHLGREGPRCWPVDERVGPARGLGGPDGYKEVLGLTTGSACEEPGQRMCIQTSGRSARSVSSLTVRDGLGHQTRRPHDLFPSHHGRGRPAIRPPRAAGGWRGGCLNPRRTLRVAPRGRCPHRCESFPEVGDGPAGGSSLPRLSGLAGATTAAMTDRTHRHTWVAVVHADPESQRYGQGHGRQTTPDGTRDRSLALLHDLPAVLVSRGTSRPL
jgi:hypothetical protein